jgi:hypothetical protein
MKIGISLVISSENTGQKYADIQADTILSN